MSQFPGMLSSLGTHLAQPSCHQVSQEGRETPSLLPEASRGACEQNSPRSAPSPSPAALHAVGEHTALHCACLHPHSHGLETALCCHRNRMISKKKMVMETHVRSLQPEAEKAAVTDTRFTYTAWPKYTYMYTQDILATLCFFHIE